MTKSRESGIYWNQIYGSFTVYRAAAKLKNITIYQLAYHCFRRSNTEDQTAFFRIDDNSFSRSIVARQYILCQRCFQLVLYHSF